MVPVPKIASNELLVKVHSVACNPTDVVHIDIAGPPYSIIGCDFSGTVVEVGSQSTRNWKIGDRIAGVVHGGLFPDKGAFAQYLKVESDLAWKPPENITDQEAATFGISAVTAMQGLYTKLDVPWPTTSPTPHSPSNSGSSVQERGEKKIILIYAASTSAGLYSIQLAKLSGYQVIATCSPHNFPLVRSCGADFIYDYHLPTTLSEIKTKHPSIEIAFDGVSLLESARFCADVVAPSREEEREEGKKGKVVLLLTTTKPAKREGVEFIHVLMYTLFGLSFAFLKPIGPYIGLGYEAMPEDRKALVRFYGVLPSLVERGMVKPIPVEVVEGGFEGLLKAIDMLRQKKVSGKKLVVDLV